MLSLNFFSLCWFYFSVRYRSWTLLWCWPRLAKYLLATKQGEIGQNFWGGMLLLFWICLDGLQLLQARKRHPCLKKFENNWATDALCHQYFKNHRRQLWKTTALLAVAESSVNANRYTLNSEICTSGPILICWFFDRDSNVLEENQE